jgi:hypothetical protein
LRAKPKLDDYYEIKPYTSVFPNPTGDFSSFKNFVVWSSPDHHVLFQV